MFTFSVNFKKYEKKAADISASKTLEVFHMNINSISMKQILIKVTDTQAINHESEYPPEVHVNSNFKDDDHRRKVRSEVRSLWFIPR